VIAIPHRARRALSYVGYPAFAVVVAVLTLYGTLPRDRIKDRLEQQFAADPTSGQPLAIGMDTTIEDVSLTLLSGPGIKGTNLLLRTRPANPNDKPVRYSVDDATVHVGLLGLMFGRPTYTFKVHALKGVATGLVGLSPDETRLEVEIGGVDLGAAPALSQQAGLPLEGTLEVKLNVVAPKNLAATSNGSFELALEDVVIGDGKAKLTVPGDPFLSQGLTFPRIRLGKLAGQAAIEKGKAKLDGFVVHSPDVDLTLEGFIELRDPIGMSQVHAYLKFKPSEALIKREPTIELMNNTLGAMAKRADGYIGFQLTGPLSAVFVMPSKDAPPGVVSRPLATGTVSAAPVAGAPGSPGAPVMMPPPIAPPHAALPPPPPPPEPERDRDRDRDEPQQPAPAPPPPPSVPAPTVQRAIVNKAVEDLAAGNTHHGEDPPAPAPAPHEDVPPPAKTE
jgi:type II secretion system protein N